jgi:hypothetical protein
MSGYNRIGFEPNTPTRFDNSNIIQCQGIWLVYGNVNFHIFTVLYFDDLDVIKGF